MTAFPSTQSYMLQRARPGIEAWAVAVGALLAAVALRKALDPYLAHGVSFVTMFGAVAVAVWTVGSRIAVLFALVGYVACHYLFAEPRYAFHFGDGAMVVGLIAYALTCGLIIAIGEAMRSAQESARERGELLRVTLGGIHDAVIATDLESRITYLNESAERLTGWSCMEVLGHPLNTVFRLTSDSVDGDIMDKPMHFACPRSSIESACRAILLARDSATRCIEHSSAPIKDGDGLIAGCVSTFRDISEKQSLEREEAARVRAARLLASIVDSSDDAIISKSLDGVIQSWNAGAERVFGFSAAEMIGQNISRIIPADRFEQEQAHIIATLQAGHRVEHLETERWHASGQRVLVSLTISPIMDAEGKIIGASEIARDLTRQRAVAQRERLLLRETAAANERFGAFFDQSAVFAAIMQPNGTVLEPSRPSWQSCGYRREQIVGKPLWEGPWWSRAPVLAERIGRACEQAARGYPFRDEMPYFVHDGKERFADVSIVAVRNADGEMLYLAATAVDITARKRAEDAHQRLGTFVENSTDFIGMCGLDFVPDYINPAGLALAGLESLEDARRRHVREFFAPEDQQRIMEEFLPSVMREGHGATEVRFRNLQSGELRWMDYKVLTLRDTIGRSIGYATIGRDITERRALEGQLRTLRQGVACR